MVQVRYKNCEFTTGIIEFYEKDKSFGHTKCERERERQNKSTDFQANKHFLGKFLGQEKLTVLFA